MSADVSDKAVPLYKRFAALLLGGIGTVIGHLFTTEYVVPLAERHVHDLDWRLVALLTTLFISSIAVGGSLGALVPPRRTLIRWSAVCAAIYPTFVIIGNVSHWPPMNLAAKARTMVAMRKVGYALSKLRQQDGTYPSISDMARLSRLSGQELPTADEWGVPYKIQVNETDYTITSFGADGRMDSYSTDRSNFNYAIDIVYRDGCFVSGRRVLNVGEPCVR